ncbi:MAG TPA: hypothetical protein PLY45_00905 [bacterium]|nr:hypothetical protein [bacterium]
METTLEAREPNWLPLPVGRVAEAAEDSPEVSEEDLFPKGEVVSFYPRQGLGTLRNARDEIVPFSLSEVELVGPKGHPKYLMGGARVGFDVSWTSGGTRVCRMKVY